MMPFLRRLLWSPALGAAVLLLSIGDSSPLAHAASPGPVRVRASAAFVPCLEPALVAFSRESGLATILEVGEPDPPGQADVVVGDDVELQRLLEGGAADIPSSFDLGYLPWVFVVPERSPESGVAALASADRVYLLGGKVGLVGRGALKTVSGERIRVSSDPLELKQASHAVVPRSLAGPGEHRPAGVRALVATTAMVVAAPHPAGAQKLLAFLKSPRGHAELSPFLDAREIGDAGLEPPQRAGDVGYATVVVDWWLPGCSLQRNGYNDPQQVLGPPDAVNLGGQDHYLGLMSLGQGGYVTVDMGASAVDGPGADIRVFQTTSREPITLYASASPQGPFALLGLRYDCGVRSPGLLSNHCDFDLHDGGLAEARYLKVEDGEIFPCLAGNTLTEGADVDAIQILNLKP
jgi:hypothetical protein